MSLTEIRPPGVASGTGGEMVGETEAQRTGASGQVKHAAKYDRRSSEDARRSRLALFEALDNATTADELIAALESTDPLNFHDGRVRERFEARWATLGVPVERCCGRYFELDSPVRSACKLCPDGPNYWRKTGERVACPDIRPDERTPFCPVCGYGWDTDGHRDTCEVAPVVPPTLREQVERAGSYRELRALHVVAVGRGEWSDELSALARQRTAELHREKQR